MSTRRQVTLFATSVEVTCPFCGGCIEAPNGSLFWTIAEIELLAERNRDCPECDEPIAIVLRESARCRSEAAEAAS